jgi:hypothetical protein
MNISYSLHIYSTYMFFISIYMLCTCMYMLCTCSRTFMYMYITCSDMYVHGTYMYMLLISVIFFAQMDSRAAQEG